MPLAVAVSPGAAQPTHLSETMKQLVCVGMDWPSKVGPLALIIFAAVFILRFCRLSTPSPDSKALQNAQFTSNPWDRRTEGAPRISAARVNRMACEAHLHCALSHVSIALTAVQGRGKCQPIAVLSHTTPSQRVREGAGRQCSPTASFAIVPSPAAGGGGQ